MSFPAVLPMLMLVRRPPRPLTSIVSCSWRRGRRGRDRGSTRSVRARSGPSSGCGEPESDRFGGCSRVVLVVAAHPHLVALVAALRCPVEDRVVAHQELRAAGVAGVTVVHGVAVARECAYAVPLGEVAGDVRAG